MKLISIARLCALALFGVLLTVPAFAKKDDHGPGHGKGKERSEHHEPRHKSHPKANANPKHAHDWQEQRGWQKHGGWRGTDKWHGGKAHHWHDEHRTWHQRGGYGGYYIGHTTFSLYFGSRHAFRIQSRPVIYRGYPRFYHQGYSFILVDPYPETWEDDWYETDEVYIEYDDGYYLYNRRRPGYALAVTIVK